MTKCLGLRKVLTPAFMPGISSKRIPGFSPDTVSFHYKKKQMPELYPASAFLKIYSYSLSCAA